ncbi:uncharacterized protein BP5553_04865 [Venustampulla echinocandica]|uniref:Xylanolytic transcriptional activator regulatory domain-containing protein n=1 Tax=Venustampulla echinocandica TaxID=2656787 RepID=A0A370TPI7_9HELO|nr:uncharacterized protein BP5553_04865 [Venustampulla echinocandica]RDL37432.1 hypothetical protein BP5553_04865 [Venustampulla echinocandica]
MHVKLICVFRHLTEVEAELARAKALLQQIRPQARARQLLSPTSCQVSIPEASSRDSRNLYGSENPVALTPHDESSSIAGQLQSFATTETTNDTIRQDFESDTQPVSSSNGLSSSWPSSAVRSQEVRPNMTKRAVVSLESTTPHGLFEWDERIGAPGEESSPDGMASLTSGNDEGGYLGVASGAALLRLTDTGPLSSSLQKNFRFSGYNTSVLHSEPAPSRLESFVDAYFQTYHVSYPIIHEPTFRAEFMEVIQRPPHNAWHVLLYVIAALGAFCGAVESTEVDLALFEEAKKRFSVDMLETGSIILVQAMALMANYLQKRNKPNSGYNYLGLARRMAMGIGLHKEFNNLETSLLKLEQKRRTWWCLFVFDAGATITFSRPLDTPTGGIEVALPLNVHDFDLTASTSHIPNETEQTTTYTHLRLQSTFHLATSRIYSCIISTPLPSASELLDLDDTCIGEWITSVPVFFSESVLQLPKFALCHAALHWRYRNFRILMYRHFVIQRVILKPKTQSSTALPVQGNYELPVADVAIQRCTAAAAESIDLITAFWNRPDHRTMMACWYALYFLFQAAMIPVICLRNDPQAEAALRWRDQIRKSTLTLKNMTDLNPAAGKCLEVIDVICGAFLDQNDEVHLQEPTKESPQTQLNSLYPWLWTPIRSGQFDVEDAAMQDSSIMDFFDQLQALE